jgi:DNA-binding HxlR family transcriptional regulator
MAHMAVKQAPNLNTLIVNKLRDGALRPTELLEFFQKTGISESDLKDALAVLIDSGMIRLSPDRYVQLCNIQAGDPAHETE